MKYRIGEVSKILNIPMETLRYYETKNIVRPRKNKSNNYRYYDAWDINFLIECKKFRSYDFALSEIETILHQDDLNSFIGRIGERHDYFKDKLKYYTLLEQKNKEYKDSLSKIQSNLWECTITQHPEIYYFTHRFNYKYNSKDKMDGLFETWIEYFPFVEALIEIQEEAALDRENNNDHSWGFSLKKEYLDAFNIPINDKVKHVKNIESVYSIIRAGEKGSFSLKLLDKALEFIKNNGYQLAGNITGNLLARVHEPNGYKRYIEVWLPIKKIR